MGKKYNALLRGVGCAAVAGALAIGSAPCALAAEHAYENGTLTINQVGNADAEWIGYQIFFADVRSDDLASNFKWASDSTKSVVLAYLATTGYDSKDENPQDAAEYIAEKISGSATALNSTTTPRTVDGKSFAAGLARTVAAAGTAPNGTWKNGKANSAPEGYYILTTNGDTVTTNSDSGTAPMWIALGGSVTTVNEKAASETPTVDKTVEGKKTADAFTGESIAYRLTGTLPANLAAYGTYHYKFTDTLAPTLSMSAADVAAVKVTTSGGTDITSSATVAYKDNVLTVDIPDLRSVSGVTYADDIYVDYTASLTKDAKLGFSAGNENTAVVTYSNDPGAAASETTTDGSTAKAYAYELSVTKLDKSTSAAVPGASYTVRVRDGEADEVGKYVQADGSLSDTAYKFVTDTSGKWGVKGIDAGTYTIAETDAATGYEIQDSDIVLTLTAGYDASGELDGTLTASVTGGEQSTIAVLGGDNVVTHIDSATASTGLVSMTTSDDKIVDLPLTGQQASVALIAAGGCLVVVGAVGASALRRRRNGKA